MRRTAGWIVIVETTVSLLAGGSSLFAQSVPAANKSSSPALAQATQKAPGGDDKFNAAIAELNEKIRRDPGNAEPRLDGALETRRSRFLDFQVASRPAIG